MPISLHDLASLGRLVNRFKELAKTLNTEKERVSSQSDDMSHKLRDLADSLSKILKILSHGVDTPQIPMDNIAKNVIDSLIHSIRINQPKFDELNDIAVKSLAQSQIAQTKFNKHVFDFITISILESISNGLHLN